MATTFEINEGDVIMKAVTGRPRMIGNEVGEEEDIGESQKKAGQDLKRSLSISRLIDGSGAGIADLIGTIDGVGIGSVAILVKTRITSMFSSILRLQRKRVNVRPNSERFRSISKLIVIPDVRDKVTYRFRVDTKTISGRTIVQSGTILP